MMMSRTIGTSTTSASYDDHWLIPVLKDARQLNPQLKIVASPWTAPKWLKTSGVSGDLGGGSLVDDQRTYDTYANYFVKFLQEYEEKGDACTWTTSLCRMSLCTEGVAPCLVAGSRPTLWPV